MCSKKSDVILRTTLGEKDVFSFSCCILISQSTNIYYEDCRLKNNPLFTPGPICFCSILSLWSPIPSNWRRVLWNNWSPWGLSGFRVKFVWHLTRETPWGLLLPLPMVLHYKISPFFFLQTFKSKEMTMMIRDHEVLFPWSPRMHLYPPAPQKSHPKKPSCTKLCGWDATETLLQFLDSIVAHGKV